MKADTSLVDPFDLNLARRNTLGDALTRAAERAPENIAVVDGDRRISYATLEHEAEAIARGIIAIDGAAAQAEPIALIMPNCYEFLPAYFGIAKSGRIVMPINYGFAPGDIAWMLGDANARTVIIDEALLPVLQGAIAAGATLDHVIIHRRSDAEITIPGAQLHALSDLAATAVGEELRLIIHSEDIAQCLYTSGTTAMPKGALTTHSAIVTGALSNTILIGETWRRTPGKVLIVLPLFHVTALNALANPIILASGTAILHNGFNPAAVLDTIERERVTLFTGLPMMWAAMSAEFKANPRDLSSIETALYAMAQMPERVLESLDEMMPNARKVMGSGQTEVVPATTVQLPEHRFTKNPAWGLPATTVRTAIMGENGELLPRGEIGEIVYRGSHVTAGYWNRPDANEEAFKYGWFHSGDIGYMDDEGVVWFSDRAKDVIKSGGENVSSMKVERIMSGAPRVKECSVIGTPHEHWGEAVTVVVVTDHLPTAEDIGAEEHQRMRGEFEVEILEYARGALGKFEVPKRVEFVLELPKTSTGKVRKNVLREMI